MVFSVRLESSRYEIIKMSHKVEHKTEISDFLLCKSVK